MVWTIGHASALLGGPIFMRGPRRAAGNFYEDGGLAGVSLLREIGLTIGNLLVGVFSGDQWGGLIT